MDFSSGKHLKKTEQLMTYQVRRSIQHEKHDSEERRELEQPCIAVVRDGLKYTFKARGVAS